MMLYSDVSSAYLSTFSWRASRCRLKLNLFDLDSSRLWLLISKSRAVYMHTLHKKGHVRSPVLRLHERKLAGFEMLGIRFCSSKYESSACLEITLRIIIICAFWTVHSLRLVSYGTPAYSSKTGFVLKFKKYSDPLFLTESHRWMSVPSCYQDIYLFIYSLIPETCICFMRLSCRKYFGFKILEILKVLSFAWARTSDLWLDCKTYWSWGDAFC